MFRSALLFRNVEVCSPLFCKCRTNHPTTVVAIRRFRSEKAPKKFYKTVTISQNDGLLEVNLDRRKLKTPMGQLFRVNSEPLALCVASEWDAQVEYIDQNAMRITQLCFAAIDDPMGRSKTETADMIIKYLETDTVCCRAEEPDEFVALASRAWDPVIRWVEHRYHVQIGWSSSLQGPEIPASTKQAIAKHLRSYDSWSLLGLQQIVEALKSVVLALALIDRHVDVKTAVALSRLEEEFQTGQWGKVEWAHDLETENLQSAVAAALLFVNFNTEVAAVRKDVRPPQ